MNDCLIRDALRAQADTHLMEAHRQAGSNVLQSLINRAFAVARHESPDPALLETLERDIARVVRKAIEEAGKAAQLRAAADQIGES